MKDDIRKFETNPVATSRLAVVWPEVSGWLQASLDEFPTLLVVDDLRDGLLHHRYTLWTVSFGHQTHAAAVTEIVHGKFSIVNILAMGGPPNDSAMESWVESFTSRMVDFARKANCHYVVEMGRKGWTRVLKPLGWEEGPIAMIRKVTP